MWALKPAAAMRMRGIRRGTCAVWIPLPVSRALRDARIRTPTSLSGPGTRQTTPTEIRPSKPHSCVRQVYDTTNFPPRKVGSHVVIFDGAKGQRTLNHWDPTSIGYWVGRTDCDDDPYRGVDPECDYYRVASLLQRSGFSENQVQAIFLRSADAYPQCDLNGNFCNSNLTPAPIPDALQQEIYLGDILRYLKCCTLDAHGHSTGLARS